MRRSSVASLDSGAESLDYGEESPTVPARAGLPGKPPWNGSGGRWLLWPMRVALWAAIHIAGCRGVMAILLNETPSAANGTGATPPATPAFPVSLGSAYALQFAQAYLNFSPDNASERARQLAKFIPGNVRARQPEFGWNGAGTLTLNSEQVAGIDVLDAHTAVVTLLAPAFFLAYASGGQATLNRFLAPGASVGGLGGTVSFGSIASLAVPRGGATRDITVTVNRVLPGQVNQAAPQLAATYDMSVVDPQSGRWYAGDIRASTQPMGNPMIRFTSSLVVPCGMRAAEGAYGPATGPRHPGQVTDVHGREG